jgi:hypothetical protein
VIDNLSVYLSVYWCLLFSLFASELQISYIKYGSSANMADLCLLFRLARMSSTIVAMQCARACFCANGVHTRAHAYTHTHTHPHTHTHCSTVSAVIQKFHIVHQWKGKPSLDYLHLLSNSATLFIYLFIYIFFRVCKSVHHTFKWINQPDAATSRVYYLSFKYSSTCFGHPHAHQQELNNCSSSLWFYRWSVVVVAVLLVVVGTCLSDHTASDVR